MQPASRASWRRLASSTTAKAWRRSSHSSGVAETVVVLGAEAPDAPSEPLAEADGAADVGGVGDDPPAPDDALGLPIAAADPPGAPGAPFTAVAAPGCADAVVVGPPETVVGTAVVAGADVSTVAAPVVVGSGAPTFSPPPPPVHPASASAMVTMRAALRMHQTP
jgi:hypothetical protein